MYQEEDPELQVTARVIGVIRTPFTEPAGTPIQTVYGENIEGQVLLYEPYAAALDDIEGFDRLWLIYWMDRVNEFKPRIIPYRDDREHGLFATRSPGRPNPIGMSVVRLLRHEGSILYIADIDMLDGTRLLDIKPYVPAFDSHPVSRAGWVDTCRVDRRRADNRFHGSENKGVKDASP
ncbi:MAG: tRNA-Thr(GGU) m(6)t(6)A37 methyltransferase TsaA [Acidobacteria bacterium]|nr:tRNA-Thr(GGU) m(6)t(6)A37 methyltransferase TsaA [Acidobacteriota bacterium]